MCGLGGELYENLQIFVDLHSVSKVFKALRRLPKIKNFSIKIQMFLKCFWLLRKPSDQKNIFIDDRFDYILIFMSKKFEDFHTPNLAKISLWSVRFKRSKMCEQW